MKRKRKRKGVNEWNGTASRGRKLCFSLRAAVKWNEMNGAPSSNSCAASPSTHSSFVGPLRAIKKMS